MTHFQYNDGGRSAAGFKGTTGDCATRAIAIAFGMDYQKAYDLVNEYGARERKSKKRRSKSNARTGVYTHLVADELPAGWIICNVSKHFVAVLDGVIHDTYDPSRNGTRCVYGYWVTAGPGGSLGE